MKCIQLTKGQVAIVDDEDFAELAQYRWHYHSGGYAARHGKMVNRVRGKTIYMHVEIMKPGKGCDVDHINRNKCDNRRGNLRIATRSQNLANSALSPKNTTGFKGVCAYRDHKTKKFQAGISIGGKRKSLGIFHTAEEAHAAYCKAATEAHGEFARFN